MPDRAEFEALRLELLRGGIANLYVERTLRELADHCDDLERASLAAGCSREEAAQRARAQLGKPDLIAAAILARPELKSWTRRWSVVGCLFAFFAWRSPDGARVPRSSGLPDRSRQLSFWQGAIAAPGVEFTVATRGFERGQG